jgi:hypothetical protein
LQRNRRIVFVLAVLIALTVAASARWAFAFSENASGTETGVGGVARLSRAKNFRPVGPFEQADQKRQYLSAVRTHGQDPFPADAEKNPWESEDAKKVLFDRRGIPAADERILLLPRVFAAERFLREKSAESDAVKPAVAVMKVSASVFLKSELDPPVILLLPTHIAVRK